MKKIFLFIFILLFSFALIACDKDNDQELPEEDEKEEVEEVIEGHLEHLRGLNYFEYLSENNPVVTITIKDYGVIKLELFPEVAKNTVNNFISYINDGSYNSSGFHRIINTFMIQGGIVANTKGPIAGEFAANGFLNKLNHDRGIISMARTSDPNSATSQFFIVHKTSPHLDNYYASFGGMISGFDVLDNIATVKTNLNDAPIEKIIIESVNIELNNYLVEEVIYYEN